MRKAGRLKIRRLENTIGISKKLFKIRKRVIAKLRSNLREQIDNKKRL